jgi:DNA-binding GntR family transcriptional regulator
MPAVRGNACVRTGKSHTNGESTEESKERYSFRHVRRFGEDMVKKNAAALSLIEAPVPMHEQVYQQIVRALMSGYFEPGQKLTYRKVAEQLGTSPMPVRTAFQRLQALRALEALPNGSAEVPLMTAESFASLAEARIAIEGAATELAAPRLNGNNLRTVRHHCKERTIAAREGDIDRYLRANFDFKFSIYQHCDNEHLLFLIETLWLQSGPFLRKLVEDTSFTVSEVLDVDFHEKAVAALEAKDIRGAREAIEGDIRDAANYLLKHAKFRKAGPG